jgi:type II secretory pathway component GspD/PulD (secretin)
MSNMKRLVVVILVLGLVMVVGTAAQEAAKPEADKQDAKAATQILRGQLEQVTLDELILLYATESGRTVAYDAKKLAGNFTFRSPLRGDSTTAENMLRAALAEYRLALVPRGDFDAIIPAAEAITECDTVAIADLETLPPLAFARIVYHLKNGDANAVRGALQNLTTRQGGVINPVMSPPGSGGTNAVILCDYVENLRELLKVLDELDNTVARISKVLTLKNTKVGEIQGAVLSASGNEVSVGFHGNERMIVLTGKRDDVDRVASVVSALDVKPGE